MSSMSVQSPSLWSSMSQQSAEAMLGVGVLGLGWPGTLKWHRGEEDGGGLESGAQLDPTSTMWLGRRRPHAGHRLSQLPTHLLCPSPGHHHPISELPPPHMDPLYRQGLSTHCIPGTGNEGYLFNVPSTLVSCVLLYPFYR